jgi:DNA ligase 1
VRARVPVVAGCHDDVVLLADVVTASSSVAATRSRTAKAAALAGLLQAAEPDEIEPVTAWMAGEVRQGRLGVGWRTLAGRSTAPATTASLTVAGVDSALSDLAATSGTGSASRRNALVGDLFAAATADEQRFLLRLLTGELRQGAL